MNRRHFLAGLATVPLLNPRELVLGFSLQGSYRELHKLFSNPQPIRWLFTGDSITQGALHTFGWRSYSEHFAERVRWELKRLKDIVINTGVSGDRLPRLLEQAEWRIFQFHPHVISVMMGMNDCVAGLPGRNVFRHSLEGMLEKSRQNKGLLLLHTPNAIHLQTPERQALPQYVDVLREFAAKHDLPLIDHYAHWTVETRGSSRLQFWLNDGTIHPNQFGHIVLARKIFQDLGIFDPKSATCRLFVP